MKKIGICTLSEACNMGAILQAFAMQETLKQMGYSPEFLRIKESAMNKDDERPKDFLEMHKHLNINKKFYNPDTDKYDVIIVGSDEIWNVEEPTFKSIDEFLGYNLMAPKIIAYAPGANTTNVEAFNKYHKGKKNLNNFTSLSARDTNGLDIIKKIAGIDAPIVLDPTFLIKSYKEYLIPCEEEKFILIYGWNFEEEEKNAIIKFAKDEKLKMYSVGLKLEWCDKFIGSDVFRFLGYMEKASYSIVSSTFHGIVFSMILNKQFVAYSHGRFKSKEMLNRAGLEDRDCSKYDELSKKLKTKIDYNKVNSWIEKERKLSLEYLKNAIEK